MAASKDSKKSKKKNVVTLSWQQFMKETVTNAPVVSSWAEEMESQNPEDELEMNIHINRAALPTAPRAARGADIDESKLPSQPPYLAYIGNLPFEITEEDIRRFFKNLTVVDVRLQSDVGGRMKGFGYVEFETRQMLIDAISFNDLTIKNRAIRVDLATQNQDRDRDRERRGGEDFHRRDDGDDKTMGDWRKKDERMSSERSFKRDDRGSDFDRFDRGSNNDQRRYGGRGNYGDRRDNEGQFDRNRDFGGRQGVGFRDREWNQNRDRYQRDERSDGYRQRDNGRNFDDMRRRDDRQDDRRSENREERWRPSGQSSFAGRNEDKRDSSKDNEWRRDGSRDRPKQVPTGGARREISEEDRENAESHRRPSEPTAPKERPKLNLMPRTKPLEESKQATSTGSANSSIFGAAKPVDTAQREREIEAKLRMKKESSRSIEEDKRVSQSSEDSGPRRQSGRRRKDSYEEQPVRKDKPANQRVKRESEESTEAPEPAPQEKTTTTTTAPTQPPQPTAAPAPAPVKIIPAPPPKINAWEARKTTQLQQKPHQEQSGNSKEQKKVSEDQSFEASIATIDTTLETETELVQKPVQASWVKDQSTDDKPLHTWMKEPELISKSEILPEAPKGNVWEARMKERETKQQPQIQSKAAEKESTTSRRTTVSVMNAMRGKGGASAPGRGAGSRRTECETTTAVVSVKQKQKEKALPSSYQEMPKLEDCSKKDWSVKNKFSSLMPDDDDDEVEEKNSSSQEGDEDDDVSGSHRDSSRGEAGFKKMPLQECA